MLEDNNKIPRKVLLRAVISKNLKKLRQEHDVTQKDLAIRTGINRVQIAKYESCSTSISLDQLLVIAKALNVEPSALLNGWEDCF